MAANFEKLDAFQRALELMVAVHRVTATFPRSELYGMTGQMRRAAGSVVSHIAEGQGRLTAGEWRQMLSQARGSLYEVEADVIASKALGFIDERIERDLRASIDRAGKPLTGLINFVRKQEQKTNSRRRASATRTP
jgi:four helix bundle protein